ncbi:mitochondrial intermediate peptidase [Roridomyces roridus]|uniref:Mitochondrial intermediate peptidase n=1 Tax=Roridomyces roridus TaxID=1738132 RepID=A0AAD7BUR0_9AGAR|nr:mitochondrial intermediate peptidase [Roridomyces roridus]
MFSARALSRRAVFRFRGCLFADKRPYSNAAPTIPASTDDRALATIFDRLYSHSSSTTPKPSPLVTTGLFGHPSLTHPGALVTLTDATLIRAQLLTERILRARESRSELLRVVKNLDRLSDLLCGVIDLAELVQNAHPERAWVEAANLAHERLCNFMNVLNTDTGLYAVLKAVLSDPSIVETLSPEAHATALIFWRDFENSAIDLPPDKRDRFVSLSSEILVLGRRFLQGVSTPGPPASIKPSDLAGLKEKDLGLGVRLERRAQFTKRDLQIYPGSIQAQMIMRSAPNEEPRRRLYIASNTSTPEQLDSLESLLRKRAELAQLVGKPSFAHMVLDDKMAKSPGNVVHFLDALMDHTRPAARSALRALSQRKAAHINTSSSLPIIQAWDRDFYCPPEPPAPPIALPPLTLGTVFMALSRLFKHLYGISLRPVDVTSGEVWDSEVTKLEVVEEGKGVIGWIYADIFARRGKASGAAHYTVRCSRRIDNDDEAGDLLNPEMEEHIQQSRSFEAVKRQKLPGQDGVYQLPLVVLVCDFSRPSWKATVLQWHDVMTLGHEMGHAMHSMIGRTEYQNVSGTRCATDFVELPSILMEHFLTSPSVLSLFDAESTSAPRTGGNHHEDPCHSIDTYSQILLASIDQIYHSPTVQESGFDSTAELAKLHNTRGLIPHVPGTSFQTRFGHLVGYAATYYSYLFDRAIASRVWGNVFSADPLNRETGEKYKREVLSYGGGKDPWKMVSTLLSAPQLESGDAEAMREVGRWRIEDEVGQPGRH